MKIWFDTEFIEDGKTIDLISIGMVREDGGKLYVENSDCDKSKASDWVVENVFPHLHGASREMPRNEIAESIKHFAGESPEFWAYYADYDWVVLCQLYGTMMNLPDGWPMFCMDVKQWQVMMGGIQLPEQATTKHDALGDAIWCREMYKFLSLQSVSQQPTTSEPNKT